MGWGLGAALPVLFHTPFCKAPITGVGSLPPTPDLPVRTSETILSYTLMDLCLHSPEYVASCALS